MTRLILFFLLLICCVSSLDAQYLENFTGQNGKGLVDAICPAGTNNINNCGSACTAGVSDNISTCTVIPPSFSGVNWTIGLGPSSSYFTDPNPNPFGFEFGSPDDFGIVGERIQVDDPDQELCWVSPTINIGSAGAVSISVGVSQTGGLESGDFVRGDYSLNGGAFVQFGFQEGNFAATNLSVSGLTGSTLVIRVCAKTNGTGEQIFIDDISVPQPGVFTGCAAPALSTVISQAGSCNPASGSIKVTASGGTPGYNVAWSGPSSGDPAGTEIASSGGMYTIPSLSAGTYTITVTDAASCSSTTTAMVTTATALSLSTQVLPADCPGAATGEIDLTVNNGVPPYSYSWSNLPGSPDPQDQTGLTAGSYTVTVTDNAGCTSTTSATVGTAAAGAYLETFSIDGKGILDNSTCSGANGTTCTNNNFVGVNWSIYGLSTLSGVDVNDYFKTTGGKLEHKDIDQDVCWESPLVDINPPGTGMAFSVDLAWFDFDREPGQDYIDVEYSLDGGAWTRVSNQVGGGTSGHTIVYASSGANDIDGSTTVNVTGLSGSTLRIRVCGLANSETELYTIDNVSVPGSNGLFCPCPTISFTATPTNTCPVSNNGQIVVSGVTGGAGPYMYSKDNGVTFQSGATFTGLAAGNYQIVVKDASACTGGPTSVNVGTFTPPAPTITGPTSVCSGGSVMLDAGGGYASYAWSNGGGSGQTATFTNITMNTTYTATVTDANGCTGTDTHEVTIQSCNIDFSGQIIFSNNNSLGVNNATVSLTGSASGSDLSDTNGDFSISSGVSSGSFTLTPTKTAIKLNGVTVGDVSAVQQHAANITLITDLYKQVAADVNKSNSITTGDASIINQSLLNNPAALAQFKTSWRFVPTSHVMVSPPWGFPEQRTYTNINTSQTGQDFYGIKTGDVVTIFANPANFSAGQSIVLRFKDQALQAGEALEAEFRADQTDDLAAIQCALRFDPAQLQFIEIQPLTALPLTPDNFGAYNIAEGEIRMAWAQPTGVAVSEAAPVFRIKFTALQSGGKLSEALQLDESVLPALAYTSALAESKVELKLSELTGTGDPAAENGVQLLQNRPNPFSDATTIGFVLPEACEAQLRVFDVSGRLLFERRKQYPAGKNEEIFEGKSAAGVLYCELTTPFGVLAKKMVAAQR